MQRDDFARFSRLLGAWSEIHSRTLSSAAVALWWQALQRFDIDSIEAAFQRQLTDPDTGQWLPKPADIIRILEGTRVDRAAVAWGKVLDAIRRAGAWRDVVFEDPVIHLAIEDQGGWPKVCSTSMEDIGYLQHRFCEAYRAHSAQPVTEYPRMLVGLAGSHNRTAGAALEPPVWIGEPGRCQLVYDRGGQSRTSIGLSRAGGIYREIASFTQLAEKA